MSVRNLQGLFCPASVAVIGASDRPGSVGSVVLRNLKAGGFKGPIWPVNLRHDTVGGERAWRDVASLPGAVDLAVICSPAATVAPLISELAGRGCRAAVVLSAGLKRSDEIGGATYEQQMLDAARPTLLRVLGPNCIGLLVPGIGLNASFAPGNALPGKLAFVSQSGALATAMLDWANGRGVGFSHFISLGDSADVDFGDTLDYLASDGGTRAILMYVESVKAARKFMSAARAAARNKPVIVVKAGRAPAGAKAAASHTGALAGSDAVFDAAVRRAGMLRVETLEALFDAAETLAHAKPLTGERLAILTNGGGAGVLAADALALAGGTSAELSGPTLAALDACLPATWPRGNPVDIIGDAPVARYQDALRVLLAAPEIDGVLFIHAPTAMVPAPDIAAACLPDFVRSVKPVLSCWLGELSVAAARSACSAAGVPAFATPERAVTAWMQRVTHARNVAALQEIPSLPAAQLLPDGRRARALVDGALREGRAWLDEVEAKQLLMAYGIPTVETTRVPDIDSAALEATRIGFPVALKVLSPQILHKSDVGGVALNLSSAQAVREAALRMREQIQLARPDAVIAGFAVQPMAVRPGAREVIVGMSSDAVFGPVIVCGRGGTEVELYRQHAIALPPLNRPLARDLVARSGIAKLLGAWRSRAAVDEEALLDALVKTSALACDLPELAELDINPLWVDENGVLALDARVRLHLPGQTVMPLAIRPYPAELAQTVTLAGETLKLRPIRPEDGERLREFYANATPSDMRMRFFMSRREVPPSELARYSQIDYDREMTFIALSPADGEGRQAMIGEARAVCDSDNLRAEFSLQVATGWQGRGLGRRLMQELVGYLRQRGTGEVQGVCLKENLAMASLARSLGFEVSAPSDGDIAMRLRLA